MGQEPPSGPHWGSQGSGYASLGINFLLEKGDMRAATPIFLKWGSCRASIGLGQCQRANLSSAADSDLQPSWVKVTIGVQKGT